ncbi:MAG: hypothetical protein ACLR7Z_05430 [Bilophila wadsworthia]
MDGIVYNIQGCPPGWPRSADYGLSQRLPAALPWCSNPESQSFKPQLMF